MVWKILSASRELSGEQQAKIEQAQEGFNAGLIDQTQFVETVAVIIKGEGLLEAENLEEPPPNISEYISLSVSRKSVNVGSEVKLQIKVAETHGVQGELVCFIESEGLRVLDEDASHFAFILGETAGSQQREIALHAVKLGQHQITFRAFFNETPLLEQQLPVYVRYAKVTRPLLSNPVKTDKAESPDLIVRVFSTPFDEKEPSLRLEYILYSPHADMTLPGLLTFPVVVKLHKLQRLQGRLAKVLAKQSTPHHEINRIGNMLYDLLFPDGFKEIYETFAEKIDSWLWLCDVEPWLPWELIKPYSQEEQHPFLAERFALSRWVEGWGTARQKEFPLGFVGLIVEAQPNTDRLIDEWIGVGKSEKWRSLTAGLFTKTAHSIVNTLKFETPIWGIHFLTASHQDKESALALSDQIGAIERDVESSTLKLRQKAPLVTVSSQRRTDVTALSNSESIWVPTFVKAGVSAFVGALWDVEPHIDRLFWTTFYRLIWRREYLGRAVFLARQAILQAYPHHHDALAYFLVGDPMAKGYQPADGEGFAVIECATHDLEEPMSLNGTYRFSAMLRRKPPVWYEGRRQIVSAESWQNVSIKLATTGFEISPTADVTMAVVHDGLLRAEFELKPIELGEHDLFIRFVLNGQELLHFMALEITVS